MRLVPINSIKEGSFLAKTVYDSDGRILLAKGIKLTTKVLSKTEEVGILSLYINDEYSDNEIEDIIRPELRQKAIKALKESFTSFSQKQHPKEIHKQAESLSIVINDIIDELLGKKNVIINLVDIKSMDNYTYQHCVNVMVLSLVLGIAMNMRRERLYNLAMGAMLHDIGKVFIPKEVLNKKGRLTEDEFAIIKEHSLKGYCYLKDNDEISPTSRIIILQHHEKMDGSGYPEGLKGNKIHEFAKVASVADVYDALTSDRPYRRGMSPNEAVEYIMGGVDRYFDYSVVKAFVRAVVPYPVGTLVKLSNGYVGVVEEVDSNYPLRPKVKVVAGAMQSEIGIQLDLTKMNNIVIKEVQCEDPAESS